MATNRIFLALFCLFSVCLSFAQTTNNQDLNDLVGSDRGENSFRVVETPQGLQIMQRLSWFRDENDFRYEVIIEKQEEDGTYTQILRQDRTENFIELGLAMGRYRYQVSVYNLLDQLEYSTNWAVFSIARARYPALDRISPDPIILNGEDEAWIIELRGENLLPESELSLRPLAEGGTAILPVEYTASPDGSRAQAVFNAADLSAGRYELYVRNPGGFDAAKKCAVRNSPPFDLFVSAAYAPAFPAYGYFSDLFSGLYPIGFSLRAEFFPKNKSRGSLGAGVTVQGNYFPQTKTDMAAKTRLLNSQVNLLYQYTLVPQLVLGLRLGAGQGLVLDLSYKHNGIEQEPVSTWMISLDGGASLKWIFHPHFFAELGISYTNLFSVDGPQGFLFPFVGAGWKY
ncbi:MAG: hypothetical protein LBH73_01345 [Spirochaetaceae bacterium]|nr:hypothetical protein [Spirochaetaceae bacterium]